MNGGGAEREGDTESETACIRRGWTTAYTHSFFPDLFYLFYYFFNVYLFLRETQSASMGGAEWET